MFASLWLGILVARANFGAGVADSHVAHFGRTVYMTRTSVIFSLRSKKLSQSTDSPSGKPIENCKKTSIEEQRASLLGARTLLRAPGLTTRNKKVVGAPGIATRRGSWHRY